MIHSNREADALSGLPLQEPALAESQPTEGEVALLVEADEVDVADLSDVPLFDDVVPANGQHLTLDGEPDGAHGALVVAPAPDAPPVLRPIGVTVEGLLWVALLLGAFLLRFGDLGRWPLNTGEALAALSAWQGSEGLIDLPAVASPLLRGGNEILFWTLSENDALARALPALAGVLALVALALWRPLLTRGGALGAALLVALSPVMLFWSRQASGEMLSVAAALFFLAAILRFQAWRLRRDAWLGAASLGVGLASGPGFWTLLGAGALWGGWLWLRQGRDSDASARWTALNETVRALQPFSLPLAGATLAAFALAATGLGTHLAGLGTALSLPGLWLQQLLASPPTSLPFTPLVLLYELPIVILGIAGAALWVDRAPGWTSFLLLWAGVTIIPATLANSGWAGGVVFVALPLALLGGIAIAKIGKLVAEQGRWEVEGIFLGVALVVGAFLWLNLLAYVSTAENTRFWLALASVAVLLGSLSVIWTMDGVRGALRALGLFAVVVLTLASFRTAWGLSFERASDPREPLVAALQPSSPDLRNAAAFLEALSVDRVGQLRGLPIAVQRSLGEVPLWYLRHFPDLQIVEGSSPDLPIVALLDSQAPAPNPTAIGQRYEVRPTWSWPELRGQALVRWLVNRDVTTGLGADHAILYITVP